MSYGHAGTDLLATMIAMMTTITMIVMIRHCEVCVVCVCEVCVCVCVWGGGGGGGETNVNSLSQILSKKTTVFPQIDATPSHLSIHHAT